MADTQESSQNIWKTASFILIGLIVGYIIGRFELATIEFHNDSNIKKTVVESGNAQTTQTEQENVLEISADDDDFLGSEDAPILIVEFSEYQCPFCAKMYKEIYPNLKKDFIDTGKVKYVYRDFPLTIHTNAINAAMAAECAGDQGKYFAMHDMLFENQTTWAKEENPKTNFDEYAKNIGLNAATFTECYESEKYTEEILKDKAEGISYGVQSTPTLFINGKLIRGVPNSYANLKSIIEGELS
ncbi:DsbA family protein [Patescibacteria group bacterium]|nr:DsbA family protein [Patescibacteria group bacterium]